MTPLAEWGNFYVIVGSSAGALIGLQFVVITLIANRPVERGAEQASGAFTTPSVVHFGIVLALSAINSAPWNVFGGVSLLWGLAGFGGVAYTAVVARRMRAQTAYRPVFEDWLFHVLLPLAAYGLLPRRPSRRAPKRARTSTSSRPRRCCCSSSASTTRGTR